jgi:hypothetical protein
MTRVRLVLPVAARGVAMGVGAVTLSACWGPAATSDPALGARMRIQSGQFVAGAWPATAPGAPGVDAVTLATNTIWPGEIDKALSGAADPASTAVAIALSTDDGYWIVPTGVPDFSAPTLPTFDAVASFARDLAPGAYTLEIRGVDGKGEFGPRVTRTLTALAAPPSDPPLRGDLVVTLTWDTESDLDLHVVDPLGNEIYHGDTETFAADGGISGRLDFDSNGNCTIDGRREEGVVWTRSPPSGAYLVRIDSASLCGQPIANWAASVRLFGTVVGQAQGVSLDRDTWGAHDRGAGLLAVKFDVP